MTSRWPLINHSRHEELVREVCLRLRRSLESVATYAMNEFNRILGRLNLFQAMVNSTNLPITTLWISQPTRV